MRQLASGLAVPMLLVDETATCSSSTSRPRCCSASASTTSARCRSSGAARIFAFRDEQGNPLPPDQPPLVVAMRERRPVHRCVSMRGFDGVDRAIEVTPSRCSARRPLIGGVAMFWERKPAGAPMASP
jgi:hypothetical protein